MEPRLFIFGFSKENDPGWAQGAAIPEPITFRGHPLSGNGGTFIVVQRGTDEKPIVGKDDAEYLVEFTPA